MIRYIKQKIWNQKWLSLSLVLGIVLLTAIAACQPGFQNGCQNKLMRTMFDTCIQENNRYPLVIGEKSNSPDFANFNDTEEDNIFWHTIRTTDEMDAHLTENREKWMAALPGIDLTAEQKYYSFMSAYGESYYKREMCNLSVQYAPDILNHITLTQGETYENAPVVDGAYPCIISEASLDHNKVIPGEVITYKDYSDQEKEIKFYIAGVFTESSDEDMYWYMTEKENPFGMYVAKDVFNLMITDYDFSSYKYYDFIMPDYTQIQNSSTDDLCKLVEELQVTNPRLFTNLAVALIDFRAKRTQINVMISVLELPIIGMMLAFLYMVSNQIVMTGQGQIATLKSRGFRKRKIFGMYLGEYGILTGISVVIGVPAGFLLCRLAAMTTDFCVFSKTDLRRFPFTSISIVYALAAGLVALICIMLPVLRHSNVSIVELKANNHEDKKMFWEKAWLDVILLALSLYFLYTFNQSTEKLRISALSGNKMDPLMFLNVCLFILAAGFFIFRLMHGFVKLVYSLRRKRWKPVAYAAFLQIIRSFRKQTFITVFMILTIAFGLFDANLDRTINRNMEERNRYEMGADVHLKEKWYIKNYMDATGIRYRYLEPDYVKYQDFVDQGLLESITRVFTVDKMVASNHGKSQNLVDVMGIETKPFGETTSLKEELYGERHWYHSLNALSKVKRGVILSENLATSLNAEVGDTVLLRDNRDYVTEIYVLEVVDIVSAWPGYEQYYYVNGEMKERFLSIININYMTQCMELKPYEIWAKKAEGVSDTELYNAMKNEKGIEIIDFEGLETRNADRKSAPEIQILNGIFTLSFLIAMSLCGIGFLIYWLISMKQRELLLGSYRAMGLSVGSINGMLILEHLFSTFLSVIGGGVVGLLATYLFVPLFGVVFLPEKSMLQIYTCYELSDIVRLFAIVLTIILICLFILRRQIKKMNITQALKLGED